MKDSQKKMNWDLRELLFEIIQFSQEKRID